MKDAEEEKEEKEKDKEKVEKKEQETQSQTQAQTPPQRESHKDRKARKKNKGGVVEKVEEKVCLYVHTCTHALHMCTYIYTYPTTPAHLYMHYTLTLTHSHTRLTQAHAEQTEGQLVVEEERKGSDSMSKDIKIEKYA